MHKDHTNKYIGSHYYLLHRHHFSTFLFVVDRKDIYIGLRTTNEQPKLKNCTRIEIIPHGMEYMYIG